jgi:hypothetical protein
MNKIDRDNLLTALYQTSNRAELLAQYDSKLSGARGTATQRYIHLLEQTMFYSHAIIFGHGVQTAHNYRQAFMSTAKKNKLLKLGDKEIEKAFSFFNRSEKWDFLSREERIEVLKERQTKKPSEKTALQLKKLESSKQQNTPKNSVLESKDSCVAIDEIKRLKADLDNETYELSRGQKVEDKETFIKIAIIAMATGARLNDIMENLTISTKRGVTFFDDGISVKEGVLLMIDTKTAQSYLRAIRGHYKDRIGKVDISTGIRKAVKRLNIPKSGNLNHLNALYKDCLTSSSK